jgi:hypothetical protein
MTRLRRLRPRSVYDVMTAVAFFIAIGGGGAYAAATIGAADIKDNAIRSRHILDQGVTTRDLAANSVGTGNVIDGSITRDVLQGGLLPFAPIAFDTHLDNGNGAGTGISGVDEVQFSCNHEEANPHLEILFVPPSGDQVTVIGTQAVGLDAPTEARFVGPFYSLESTGDAVNVDAMVQFSSVGRWVHYQVGGTWTATGGCDFGGIYTPPSN